MLFCGLRPIRPVHDESLRMDFAKAFAPANISLVFETYESEPPHDRGSLGVGITLTEGATVRISRHDGPRHHILANGEPWEFPTVRTVLSALSPEPLRAEIEAAWPFGCGFGMSGASALAAAFAVNQLLSLNRGRMELGMIAHRAEVENSTGLGDVGGQFNGGIMIKRRRFEPLAVEQLPVPPQPLHVRVFGPIHTPDVINSREKLEHINHAGHTALAEITRLGDTLTIRELLLISRRFSEESGLLQSARLREALEAADHAGHAASMIMLGEAAVSTGPFPGSREVHVLHDGVCLCR
jgi:pantoate kinase